MAGFLELVRHFHPLLPRESLGRRPIRVYLGAEPLVLFRDHQGVPQALHDRCPHRHAPLSSGTVDRQGRIVCPYHGWAFTGEGHGESPSQPGFVCKAQSFQVVDRHGYLWVAGRETQAESFPVLDKEGFEFAGSFTALLPAPLPVVLDNFSEDEHIPWIHKRLGWSKENIDKVSFQAHNHADRTEVSYKAPQRMSLPLRLMFVRTGDMFHNQWVTRFDPVRADFVFSWTDDKGTLRPLRTRALVFMIPETDKTTRFQVFTYVSLARPSLRFLLPLVKKALVVLGRSEVRDDARFLRLVADTAETLKGMRLGKYDKPLIHNRKLLQTIYYGNLRPPESP